MNPIDQAITSMLPAPEAAAYRAKVETRKAREQVLVESINEHCAEALGHISSALRFPRISAGDIELAVKRLQAAHLAATELDK